MPIGLWTTSSAGTDSRNSNLSVSDQRSRRTSRAPVRCTTSKSGGRAVRRLGRGVDAEHDVLDLGLRLRRTGCRGRHLAAVPLERGVGEVGR